MNPDMISHAHVVICDDSITNVLLLTKLVEAMGISNVHGFSDPRRVQPFIAQHPEEIDLLLLDVEMPYMDGFEVMQALREQRSSQHGFPILIITGHQETEIRHRALQEGANDFVSKPFDPVEVALRVRNLLSMHHALKAQRRYAQELELQVQRRTSELSTANDLLVRLLALAGEMRDGETGKHVARVGRFSRILAEGAGLPADVCFMIERAAPLHDVGKIGIPDSILLKGGMLDTEERQIMNTHTLKGVELLGAFAADSQLLQMAASIALHHHEKWDGSGYPRGISGESIPIEGRIASISDVFDALTMNRPYKQPWPIERVVDYMQKEAGRSFDPTLIEIFRANIDEFNAVRIALMDTE